MPRRTIEKPRYPIRDGLPLSVNEVLLPDSQLEDAPHNYNNHHLLFPERLYGRTALYLVLRNLDGMQELVLKDQHNAGKTCLHSLYLPPPLPKPTKAMDRVLEAVDNSELLRHGIARDPRYTPITDELLDKVMDSYGASRALYRSVVG